MATSIFSDSWFRVSGLRVALLPSVEVKTQVFRGRIWHVLQDTYTQRFFRASKEACHFIQSLNTDRTVEDVWEDFVNQHPEDAPSREEVIQLLSQLHLSNLLYSLQHSDNEAIVKRYKKQKNKELRAKLASFLFLRVPLWNPDLDDGVIINYSLLWRMVPYKPWQKTVKACWDELAAGKHDWAGLAMHLWPDRVVPKCAMDRSLAIAHGLEGIFWAEGAEGKWAARAIPLKPIDSIIQERSSPAVSTALRGFIEPQTVSGNSRISGRRKATPTGNRK